MAVRIYALAKELKLDSKELVDICTKAGVPGKGSALASLTEEEAEKEKARARQDAEDSLLESRTKLANKTAELTAEEGKLKAASDDVVTALQDERAGRQTL